MSELRKSIPHIQQEPGSAKCGATCMKMILDYYGIQDNIQTIWESVSRYDESLQRNNCNTFLMVQYLHQKHGLFSAFVSIPDPEWLIRVCLKRDVELVPLYRPNLSSGYAHYSVIVDIDEQFIYVNDPEQPYPDGAGLPIKINVFLQMLRPIPNSEINTPHTFLLVSRASRYIVPCQGWNSSTPAEKHDMEMPSFLAGKDMIFAHPDYEVIFDSLSRK